ncbi:nucleoid-associated protein [Vibrio splendidus]|uniref:hypothetical protein n=1 Tax=Vibrio splendidus TaxID=29497 RepID=UPI00246940DC|nr:hypothetical protein [Vibrio splendidus]MDH5912814.1 nucleoid-associated protein [Vibrio splendidus]MDH5941532.1 nucleoid-associated protein [Vibrio splendidus]MDH5986737.1 nucleoid-associated protein [Vibrio splendidus]MDH5992810.1 nucleoid-associated protein [Vibrio splendidus]MDH6006414.1 nucleoid-associated protein [Vibrio splendidus]
MNSTNVVPAPIAAISSPVVKVHVYDIDIAQSTVVQTNQSLAQVDGLNSFLIELTQNTVTDQNHKLFNFNVGATSKSLLQRYLTSKDLKCDDTISMELANKLLHVEKETSGRVQHLHKGNKSLKKGLKKGSLVVCYYKSINRECIIVTKLDFEDFLERGTYKSLQGLPQKNGVLKSCVINIENGKLSNQLFLLDSNKSIASFWSVAFLESKPMVDDSINTKNAFREISGTFSGLARSAKVDYQQLKNNLISYFSTNTDFTVTSLLDALIGSYIPVSDKVDLHEIKTKIEDLVSNGKFDGNFKIDEKEIKAKFKQTLKLEGGITVTTSQNFNDRIFKKVIDGDNYMLIKTTKGLEEVKDYPTSQSTCKKP